MSNCLAIKWSFNAIPESCRMKLLLSASKYCLLFVLGLLSFRDSKAQSSTLTYAHRVIDTLTSVAMDGRGYTDSSDWKAAGFIKQEMIHAGLQPFGENYFQPYTLNANVFPGSMKLNLNGKDLVAGKDFLADAGSGSCKGKFRVEVISKAASDTAISSIYKLLKELANQKNQGLVLFIAKDDFTKEQYQLWHQALYESVAFGAIGVVECTDKKLTWDASQEQLPWCYIQMKGELPPSKKSSVTIEIESVWKKNYGSQNVIGYVKGTSVPDSFLVFTAHYDHLGEMGDGNYFPGANDNASGTSMVLNLATYYAQHPSKYSIAFIFFSGEELGLLGSQYYVSHPLFPLTTIKFLVNLDIVGTGDDGIKVVNATEFTMQFERLVKLNEREQLVKVVSPRGKAANSDHYSFYEKGVPCFFIYTMGGISAYHDVFDRPETLPLTDYEDLFKLLIDFANSL
ncbi:MAG: M28 family peptidase [Chitinophagales bacterium]